MYDSTLGNNGATTDSGLAAVQNVTRNIAGHLGELRGLAQLLVYLADQIEETDQRLDSAQDPTQIAFLNRVLSMYSGELEKRHHGLSGRISAISLEVSSKVKPTSLKS